MWVQASARAVKANISHEPITKSGIRTRPQSAAAVKAAAQKERATRTCESMPCNFRAEAFMGSRETTLTWRDLKDSFRRIFRNLRESGKDLSTETTYP